MTHGATESGLIWHEPSLAWRELPEPVVEQSDAPSQPLSRRLPVPLLPAAKTTVMPASCSALVPTFTGSPASKRLSLPSGPHELLTTEILSVSLWARM